MPPQNNQPQPQPGPAGYPSQPPMAGQPYPPASPQSYQPPQQYGQPSSPPSAGSGYPAQPFQPLQPLQPQTPPAPAYAAPVGTRPPEKDPYAFFMNAQPKQKASLLAKAKTGSKFTKIVLLAVALFVVLGILAVVLSASRNNQPTAPGLTTLVNRQQEIIRVSKLGVKDAQSASLQNFSETAILATTSAQQELINYVNKHGGAIDPKQLGTIDNKTTDQTLDSAKAASVYDATYKTTMQQLLTDYTAELQQVHAAATVGEQQTLIDKNIASTQLLQQMLEQ